MREIKFRAYDEESKKIYQITDINFSDYVANGVCYGDWKDFSINNLLQYTGLKDKNGVEIYEGDILKYPYVRGSSVNYSIETGVIEWSDEYCGFIIDEVQNIGGFCGIESKHMNELEVIGNIYENKDLLE